MKLRIGIVFGGNSKEREISFAGGRTVYDNLNNEEQVHQTALNGYKPYDFINRILEFGFQKKKGYMEIKV